MRSAEQPGSDIDGEPQNRRIENKPHQRMRQHHPAQASPGDAHIGGLHGNADGEREVVEVPVIRVAFAIGEAQRRFVLLSGIEQPGVVQAENAADQQPGASHGQAGIEVVQGQRRALQAAAGHQLQGDGGEAGDGGDAHGEQDQAGVFVFDAGYLADLFRAGVPAQIEHQQQVKPYAKVPAGEKVLHAVASGDQPGTEQADHGGDAQAWVGAGQAVESHGASFAGCMASTLDRHEADERHALAHVGAALCRERAAKRPRQFLEVRRSWGRFAPLSRHKAAPTKSGLRGLMFL
ncbi:conserved protein of unknown function [Pseudomonas sp. JV551A1]|nr:conserved protein of unknown function [Pseudomonas sp. JV551A1]